MPRQSIELPETIKEGLDGKISQCIMVGLGFGFILSLDNVLTNHNYWQKYQL